jgi:hypothetical protein
MIYQTFSTSLALVVALARDVMMILHEHDLIIINRERMSDEFCVESHDLMRRRVRSKPAYLTNVGV